MLCYDTRQRADGLMTTCINAGDDLQPEKQRAKLPQVNVLHTEKNRSWGLEKHQRPELRNLYTTLGHCGNTDISGTFEFLEVSAELQLRR